MNKFVEEIFKNKHDQSEIIMTYGQFLIKTIWRQSFDDLGKVLDSLGEIFEAPLDEQRFIMDGTIQRFEFTIELFWKNFKNLLELEGKEALTPRQAISLAYQTKWFDNEKLWMNMLQDRNMSSNTYKEVLADEIYARVKLYYPEMQATYDRLKTIDLLRKYL